MPAPNDPTSASIEAWLDRLHTKVRNNAAWQRLAVVSRLLLALAFIPTGSVKALGRPFTTMGTDMLIGQFFDVLWRTGGYWRFIGIVQITAGTLLLFPRTALIGALLFTPIIANIFVITVALHFQGTPFITGPMLVACVFLICWDYPRWKSIVFAPRSSATSWWPTQTTPLERWGTIIGAGGALLLLLGTRGLAPSTAFRTSLVVCAIAAIAVLASWGRRLFSRTGTS